ncbi:hypothetical protein F5Y17DRAFT_438001 [Xylariaceae sp. FL0594]|nr:hypothetical protein F5Y17DRAFT_438001 [Xylariaceae sp. FL0594]
MRCQDMHTPLFILFVLAPNLATSVPPPPPPTAVRTIAWSSSPWSRGLPVPPCPLAEDGIAFTLHNWQNHTRAYQEGGAGGEDASSQVQTLSFHLTINFDAASAFCRGDFYNGNGETPCSSHRPSPSPSPSPSHGPSSYDSSMRRSSSTSGIGGYYGDEYRYNTSFGLTSTVAAPAGYVYINHLFRCAYRLHSAAADDDYVRPRPLRDGRKEEGFSSELSAAGRRIVVLALAWVNIPLDEVPEQGTITSSRRYGAHLKLYLNVSRSGL